MALLETHRTATAPKNRSIAPKRSGKDHLPTINFQVRWLLVSRRVYLLKTCQPVQDFVHPHSDPMNLCSSKYPKVPGRPWEYQVFAMLPSWVLHFRTLPWVHKGKRKHVYVGWTYKWCLKVWVRSLYCKKCEMGWCNTFYIILCKKKMPPTSQTTMHQYHCPIGKGDVFQRCVETILDNLSTWLLVSNLVLQCNFWYLISIS